MRVFFGMETPLRGRSGGHTGTAPTVPFGGLRVDGWFRLVGLRVNGYLVCVELRRKI